MFTPPTVSLGTLVVWKPERGAPLSDAAVGIVTRAPHGTDGVVALILFPPDSKIGVPKDSVRHIDDPDNPRFAHLNNGVWDLTDSEKAARLILDSMVDTYAAEDEIIGGDGEGV